MHQKYGQDPLIKNILTDLKSRFSKHVVSVFGIGSYFDDNLPDNWIKNDVDLIVIVDSLKTIPKQDWTEVRYEKKQIGDKEIWIGFNTLEGLQNREQNKKESFANYEWSLLDLKLPENSVLLYGRNVRNQLPEVSRLQFDYDNVLIRSLYHLNKSFKDNSSLESMREFTKGVFKFSFYLCIYFDSQFRLTSIVKIGEKIKLLVSDKKINSNINSYLEEAVIFRMTSQFKNEFASLRDEFVKFVLSLLMNGTLHQQMTRPALIRFFRETFGGFGYLIRFVKKLETLEPPKFVVDEEFEFSLYDSQLKIVDIELDTKSITVYGRIKEIYNKFRFERSDGSEGQGASFLLHDPSGDIRVILWDQRANVFTRNEFNVGEFVKINNGFAKKGKAGTEIHVGKYGSIILSPQGVDLTKHPNLKDAETKKKSRSLTQKLDSMGIKDGKISNVICPYCSSKCSSKLKFCGICGEPLPESTS